MLSGFPGKRTDLTRLLSRSSDPHKGHFVDLPVWGSFVVEARCIASLRKRPRLSVITRNIRRTTITVPVAIKTKISIVDPPFTNISVKTQDFTSLRRVYPYL